MAASGSARPGRQLTPLAVVLGALLSAALGFWVSFGLAVLGDRLSSWNGFVKRQPFRAEAWIEATTAALADARGHTPRQSMVDDLLASRLAPGMDRVALRALLGTPTPWPIFRGASWFGKEDEAWWLGASSSPFRDGCDWLYLDFDARGMLQRALVTSERAAEDVAP